MTTSNDDFFFTLRASTSPTARTEQRAVATVLKQAKIKKSTAKTFEDLQQMGFPLRLVAVSLNRSRMGAIVNDLMRRPTRSELYAAYTDAVEKYPDSVGSLGIVFSQQSSLLVFHDLDSPSFMSDFGFYVRIEERHFCLEKLAGLAENLGTFEDW
jgi:hypothetical protein